MLRLPHRRLLAAAAPPWSPLLLGTALVGWFDAQSVETVTQTAGLVSAWASRVNGWSVVQPVGAAQPTYTASLAAWAQRPVLDFASSLIGLFQEPVSLPIFQSRSGGTLAASLQFVATPAADSGPIFVSTGGAGSTRATFGGNGIGNWSLRGRRLDSDTLVHRQSAVPLTGAPALAVASFDWAAGSAYLHVNAVPVIAPGAWTSAGAVEGILERRVAFGAAAQPWSGGRIGSVLLVNRLLTPDERLKWEGHEAHRLGLAATLLPGDHPFAAAPPRASLADREAFADGGVARIVSRATDRGRAERLYVPLRRPVPGWRAAA